jgi:hypothetical protein
MRHWLLVAGLFVAIVSWISTLQILTKLRTEGYKYSDIFGLRIYLRYWQTAPERGWSRIPVFVIPIGGACCGLLFILSAVR